MQENNNRNTDNRQQGGQAPGSMGNQQQTTQTGAQNASGENIDQQEDSYTDDLRQSGNRPSSNRRDEAGS